MQLKKMCGVVVHCIHRVSNFFAWISGVTLLAMAALTFVDVFCRYVLSKPIKGSQEIVELLMVITLYYGLANGTYLRKHITVDAVLNKFSEKVQYIIYGISSLLCIFISAPVTVRMTIRGIENITKTNVATGSLNIPLAPFYLIAALGCLLLSMEFLIDGILRFIEARELHHKANPSLAENV